MVSFKEVDLDLIERDALESRSYRRKTHIRWSNSLKTYCSELRRPAFLLKNVTRSHKIQSLLQSKISFWTRHIRLCLVAWSLTIATHSPLTTAHHIPLLLVARVDKCVASMSMKGTPSKSVTFNEAVLVKRVRHILSYTKEEIKACWYDDCELSAMIQSMKDDVKQLETRNKMYVYVPPPDLCTRGLEHRTASAAKIKSQRRQAARDTVLWEQLRQRSRGVTNLEHIAEAYALECRRSQDMARKMGTMDARNVAQH